MELNKNEKTTLQKEFRRNLRELLLNLSDSSEDFTDKEKTLIEYRKTLRTEDMDEIMNIYKTKSHDHIVKIISRDVTLFKQPLILVYDIDFSEWYNEKTEKLLFDKLSLLDSCVNYKPADKMTKIVDEATKDQETGELNDFGQILQTFSDSMMKDKDPMQLMKDLQSGNIGDMVTNMQKIIDNSGINLAELQKSSEAMISNMGMDKMMDQFKGEGGPSSGNMMGNMMNMMLSSVGGEEELPEVGDKIDSSKIDQKYLDMVMNSSKNGKHTKRNKRRREQAKQAKRSEDKK